MSTTRHRDLTPKERKVFLSLRLRARRQLAACMKLPPESLSYARVEAGLGLRRGDLSPTRHRPAVWAALRRYLGEPGELPAPTTAPSPQRALVLADVAAHPDDSPAARADRLGVGIATVYRALKARE